MAKITITQYLNFKWNEDGSTTLLDHFFSSVDDGSGDGNTRTLVGDGETLVVHGTGLQVDGSHVFSAGTVTSIETDFDGEGKALVFSGLSINAAAARSAWESASPFAPWKSTDAIFFNASVVDPDGDGAGIGSFFGDAGRDSLVGSNGFEELAGAGNNDTLRGLGGNDTLWGDAGNDSVDGGSGADSLYGYTGNDTIIGGSGNDYIQGWTGNDSLLGGTNDDSIIGGAGKDIIDGGTGIDLVWYDDKTKQVVVTLNGSHWATVKVNGSAEDKIRNVEDVTGGRAGDKLTGDSHGNMLWGNEGNDTLAGAGGNDWLLGYTGADSMAGGSGDDTLTGWTGKDSLDGGSGRDVADYSDKTTKVEVTLNGSHYATVRVNGVAEDKIKNVEDIWGGKAGDKLTGDAKSNYLFGDDGNDTLKGGAGKDYFEGAAGNDVLTGGSGSDDFRFDGVDASHADIITDFEIGKDKLVLLTSFFSEGFDLESQFVYGTSAQDSDDRLIYDLATGNLYYDADGVDGTTQFLIATLSNKAGIGSADFDFL